MVFEVVLLFLKDVHGLFMVVSHFTDALFVLFDCRVEFAVGTSSFIHATLLNTFFFTVIEQLEFMEFLLRGLIMLPDELFNFIFFLVNLLFQFLYLCLELLFSLLLA